ncbi:MAG: hypothetical protein JJU36_05605, partial [Phycisphaeraceae bacterium]|nr:hypothetical protein [Phycisphaeraceae bacterium]
MPANFRLRHTATITAAIAGALVAGSSVSMASTPKADDVLFQHEVGQMLANMDIRIGNIALAEIEHVAAREAEALDRDGLLAQGTLTRTRPTLSKIAVIGLKDGRLAINRNAWEAAAKADEPEQAQGAAQQIQLGGAGGGAIQIRGRVQIAGMDVNDPLTRLWNELRTQAGAGSSGTSISGDRRTLTFDGPALSGRLITTSQTFNLLLIEDSGIGRTLQISEASPNRLRINVLAANGDLLTLNQRAEGELHLMMIEGTNVRQARGESFIELYLTDPKWFDEKVLPTFAGLGITMPHGPLSEPMR